MFPLEVAYIYSPVSDASLGQTIKQFLYLRYDLC